MSNDPGPLPLGSFLNGRLKPDAQDLLAIRARLSVVNTRLAEISHRSVSRLTNRSEIDRLTAEASQLGTCEIIAREHVRANPHQSRNLELFEAQALEAKLRERATQQALPTPVETDATAGSGTPHAGFNRVAWRIKRALARSRPRSKADED